jgi:hypothetical protein
MDASENSPSLQNKLAVIPPPASGGDMLPIGRLRAIQSAHSSLALTPRPADLDFPGGHFAVFFLADKIDLSRANIRMAREFANFVHRRSVAKCPSGGRAKSDFAVSVR